MHRKWFLNQSNKLFYRVYYPGTLLTPSEETKSKNKINYLEYNAQSLLHGTRFRLGHQQKPVEHEILLQRSPSFNKGRIQETRQDHKRLVDECIPIHIR